MQSSYDGAVSDARNSSSLNPTQHSSTPALRHAQHSWTQSHADARDGEGNLSKVKSPSHTDVHASSPQTSWAEFLTRKLPQEVRKVDLMSRSRITRSRFSLNHGSIRQAQLIFKNASSAVTEWFIAGHSQTTPQLQGDESVAFSSIMSRTSAALHLTPSGANGLSRFTWLVVLCLFALGVREMIVLPSPDPLSNLKRSKPSEIMLKVAHRPRQNSLATHPHLWKVGQNEASDYAEDDEADVTAIVLHWKRTQNVVLIAHSLCQYSFIKTVHIWNNNPQIILTREALSESGCSRNKLRIFNSPRNMLFLARYLACASARTPYCFFQDDDWLVLPLRSLYSQFSRDPEGAVVVHTNTDVATLYGLEWCFFQSVLHTCFSWVGTGAFTAKSHVQRYLSTISEMNYARDELSHADNSFTTFQNEAPYILSSRLTQLPSPFGHSDGTGIQRNKNYIDKGLKKFSTYVGKAVEDETGLRLPMTTKLVTTPLKVDVSKYKGTPPPPTWPHPYAHHSRALCYDDSGVFITNVALLPPPDSVPYPGPDVANIEKWETHLGSQGRGWIEGGELFAEEETWAKRWPYSAATDGDLSTTFRSPDVVQIGDYVGLGLLATLDPQWVPKVQLCFVLEGIDVILPALVIDISIDGYKWLELPMPSGNLGNIACSVTKQASTSPDIPFPLGYLTSSRALRERMKEELKGQSIILRWWRRRRRRAVKLSECQIELSTALPYDLSSGWRFIRLRSQKRLSIGWGVYEIYVRTITSP